MTHRDRQLVVLGRALRRARLEREMSQEGLGSAAGVAPKHVSEIERGNRDPRLTTLLKLAGALGLEGEEITRLCQKLIAVPEG